MKPVSYSVAADWKLAMWPPSSEELLVRLDDDRGRVPAHVAADELLDLAVPGMGRLLFRRDGVDIGGVGGERQLRALAPGGGDYRIEDFIDLADALEGLDRIERVEPFVGLVGLVQNSVVHRAAALPFTHTKVASVGLSQSSHGPAELAIALTGAAAMSDLHARPAQWPPPGGRGRLASPDAWRRRRRMIWPA